MIDRPLLLLLAASAVLHGCAIWWGVPHGYWAVDETRPDGVLRAIDARFGGGWFSAYGPVPYYIYAIVFAPIVLAGRAGLLDPFSTPVYATLQILSRLVVLAMAAGVVATLYVAARDLWDRRAAIFAALAGMSILPFVYYAKMANVDVPYTFWALLAIVSYGRIVRHRRPASCWYFATFATLAVCTKDQAYAFFVFPSLHVLWIAWRDRRTARLIPALAGAAAWALVLFALCYNVVFNWAGFVRHFTMVGSLPERIRVFDPGPIGQLQLAWATVEMLAWSMNWVGFAAAVAGIVIAVRGPAGRRHLWLLVPIASYYVTFIMPIGVFYDRYYLAVCLLLSLFAGRFLALGWEGRGTAARAAIAAALAFSVWRGGSVNLLMLADSRMTVERWVEEHVSTDSTIAVVGVRTYLPRLMRPNVRYYRDVSDLRRRERPGFVVINVEYFNRFREDSPEARWARALRSGETGYARAFSAKNPVPLAILWHEPMFRDLEMDLFTNLDKINSRIEVYQRSR